MSSPIIFFVYDAYASHNAPVVWGIMDRFLKK